MAFIQYIYMYIYKREIMIDDVYELQKLFIFNDTRKHISIGLIGKYKYSTTNINIINCTVQNGATSCFNVAPKISFIRKFCL